MAYTMARLDQALKLFRKTKRQLVLDGFPVSYLENWIESKYSLRNRTLSRSKSLHSTWIDNDDSADYNPKNDLQPKRKRVSHPEGAAGPDRETKRQRVRPKQDDDKLLVTLKIQSVEGKALLSSLSSDKDHKQRDDTHHQQPESYSFPSDLSSFSSSLSTLQRYSLRNRGQPTDSKYPWSSFQFSPSQSDYHSITSSTQSLLSLDLGHPAARGCKSCWEFNHECSLLSKPLTYPCQVCREDRVDCELIIPPKRKRGCESCNRRKKVICSYIKDARDHHLPCKQCQGTGIQCFAGPAKHQQESQESEIPHNNSQEEEEERSQDGPSCGSSSSHFHHGSPPARPVNLTEEIQPLSIIASDVNDGIEDSVRHGNFKVSSTTNAQIDERKAFLLDILSKPWKPPTSSSTPTEPQKSVTATATAPKEETKTPTKENKTATTRETDSPTPQQQNKLSKSSSGIVRIITTSFAHPINFAYEPSSPKDKPCHFCTDFTYGMLGLGELKVEVIDYRDGTFHYIEIEGGHTGAGHEPMRMCTTCALERVHIVNCAGHTIAPLEGYDPETFDYDAAFASLVPSPAANGSSAGGNGDDGGSGTPVMKNPWYMLCPNPAFFGCVTAQSVNKFQEPVTPSSPDAVGCGLLLCTNCAKLMQIFHCDVAKVVKWNRERDGQDGVRADAVYLLPGNDLYRFYCGGGESDGDGGKEKEGDGGVDLTGHDRDRDIVMLEARTQTIDLTGSD